MRKARGHGGHGTEPIDRRDNHRDFATMPITIAHIRRYPVKGLSAEALASVVLEAGGGVAEDRRFALAHTPVHFDRDSPRWLPKTSFLMLMRNERLAALETRFDEATGVLTVFRDGKEVARGRITEPVGRAVIEDFFAAYMKGEARGKPRLLEAPPGHMFSDHAARLISLINLASVRDLERVVGAPVDPVRFRANLYFEGLDPWAEFAWVDTDIAVGAARLRITARIDRCAATNVDPASGARDMNIPKALQRGFGHPNMGVYATVIAGGPVSVGDEIRAPA